MPSHVRISQRNQGNAIWLQQLRAGGHHAFAPMHWWSKRIELTSLTLPAATTGAFNLNTLFPNDAFPVNCVRGTPLLYVETPGSGGAITALTAALGDAGDPNGLMTSQDVFTGVSGGVIDTTGAEFEDAPEAAFVPQLTLDSTDGNLDAITAGVLHAVIGYRLFPAVAQGAGS